LFLTLRDCQRRPEVEVTQVNLNDATVEGMRHKTLPITSGAHDAEHRFKRFIELMDQCGA